MGSETSRDVERLLDCDKVEAMHVVPKYDDQYVAIKDACLLLSGALVARIDSNPQFREFEHVYPRRRKAVLTVDSVAVGIHYPDAPDSIQAGSRLCCLSIRREPYAPQFDRPSEIYEGEEVETSELVMGLVLEGVESRDGFKRIGLARWVKRSLFADSTPISIRLV